MSSLESAIRILHCLTAETPRLRVSELSERLNIPKSSVSRLLKVLSEGGVLDRDDNTKEYVAGPVALQLGGLYMAKHDLLDLVDDAVCKLVDQFGFTGYVAVRDGAEAVVLRCRHGTYPLKFVLDVGSRQPAAEAALGIGLLAQLTELELKRVLSVHQRGGRSSHHDVETPVAQIHAFRQQGWVEVPCLSVPGITAIGSAIEGRTANQPAIGFSISFPDTAADRALRGQMAAAVRAAASHLTSIASPADGFQARI